MNRTIELKRVLSLLLFAVVLSFLCEFLLNIDFGGVFDTCEYYYEKKEYYASDLTFSEAELLQDGKVVCEEDPKIIISGLDCYVHSVKLIYHDLSSDGLAVQIYYDTGKGFTEKQVLDSEIKCSSKAQIIDLKKDVSNLRIDIGEAESDSYYLDKILINPRIREYIYSGLQNMSAPRCAIFCALILGILLFIDCYEWTKDSLFRYRWQIGFILVMFSTLLKLQGSSIGFLAEIISGSDTSRLFGIPRFIRSDEYVVFTQMALSQVKSGFKWFSDIWGYSASDMFMIYGQPVANIVSIFRPFSFPYLFLGAEYGLAFFWSSRLVVLLLVSFEFGRIFTKDDKGMSLSYAVLVAFSPVVQWWFSINGFVEMLIFGQAAVILTVLYFREKLLTKKIIYILLMVICAGGYVLTLYPAWMIPLFFVFLVCEINVILDNKGNIHLGISDFVIFAAGIIILSAAMVYIFIKSSDTIFSIINTDYPGNQVFRGGSIGSLLTLVRCWTSWIWTFINLENPCEIVDFISFFPLGIILAAFALKKNRDRWIITLGILDLFLIIYQMFLLPDVIGTVTLLSHSSPRIYNAVGLLNLIILFRALIITEQFRKPAKCFFSAALLVSVFSIYEIKDYTEPAMRWLIILNAIFFAGLIAYSDRKYIKRLFIAATLIISFIGGVLVNPVNSGLDSIYGTALIKAVERINTDEGMWIVCDDNPSYSNLPTIIGAKTVNALATYPDNELWKKLGLEDKKKKWNRYAHITVKVSDKTSVKLLNRDQLRLNITVEDMQNLGIRYIISREEIKSDNVRALCMVSGFIIYELASL